MTQILRPSHRSRSRLLWCSVGTALFVFSVGSLALWSTYRSTLDRRLAISVPQKFHVERGRTLREVANELATRGWIAQEWPIRLEARRRGIDRRMIPGWYLVQPAETARILLQRIAAGDTDQLKVTFPEGWRLQRILRTLADSCEVPLDSLTTLAADSEWLVSRSVPGPGLEGYLLPDTYRLPRGEPASVLLDALIQPGALFFRDSLTAEAESLGMSRREVWSLASIIESEAAVASERDLISAVFHNRLRLGMRLESDPTVLFALGRDPGRVSLADLDVDSPYNTYRRPGLPPGPICAPGRASLRAAIRPRIGSAALFFVARGDGTHVFSESFREHLRARAGIASATRERNRSRNVTTP